MIIKNDYIKIKGDREIILKNYIYDIYLQLLTQAQYKKEVMQFEMRYCFLKFDTPFDSVLNKDVEDFDIYIIRSDKSINGTESKIEASYFYYLKKGEVIDVETDLVIEDLSDYYDRKITAIGFGGVYNLQKTIFSCVDTSNYSIYLKSNMNFERKDIFTTDTIATNGIPHNLKPFSTEFHTIIDGHGERKNLIYPVLYSIGLGTIKGQMDEEFVIGTDIDIIEETDTSFGFNIKKGLEPTKFPRTSIYPRSSLYPVALKINKEIHPHKRLYSGSGIVPLLSNYKYIIYKYRYYYFDSFLYDYVDLDKYFTINLPNETEGLFEIVTKIERSDV